MLRKVISLLALVSFKIVAQGSYVPDHVDVHITDQPASSVSEVSDGSAIGSLFHRKKTILQDNHLIDKKLSVKMDSGVMCNVSTRVSENHQDLTEYQNSEIPGACQKALSYAISSNKAKLGEISELKAKNDSVAYLDGDQGATLIRYLKMSGTSRWLPYGIEGMVSIYERRLLDCSEDGIRFGNASVVRPCINGELSLLKEWVNIYYDKSYSDDLWQQCWSDSGFAHTGSFDSWSQCARLGKARGFRYQN